MSGIPSSSTKLLAYKRHSAQGRVIAQWRRILAYMESERRPLCRREIAEAFNRLRGYGQTWDGGPAIPLASVCGRIKALLELGHVRVAHQAPDLETGHEVEFLEVVSEPTQRRLPW